MTLVVELIIGIEANEAMGHLTFLRHDGDGMPIQVVESDQSFLPDMLDVPTAHCNMPGVRQNNITIV